MKEIAIFSNDWHIKDDNVEEIYDLVVQKCDLADERKVELLAVLGDVFDSRKSQTQLVLHTLKRILDLIEERGKKLIAIPGNHDKSNYDSHHSFLDAFTHHPALQLIPMVGMIPFNKEKVYLHFFPFFAKESWEKRFDEYINDYLKGELMDGINILCTHIAVNGSVNNDGSKVKNDLSVDRFKLFDSVLSGHYHNKHRVGNFYHLPSIKQNNFGEDNKKGFTVLFSDGSHTLVKSKFKEYVKVDIDVDKISRKQLVEKITDYSEKAKDTFVRFVLKGGEDKLKSIDKSLIQSVGIDVKTKAKDIEIAEDFDTVEIKRYTQESIIDEFAKFCDEFDKNYTEGIKYLKNK